MCALRWIASTDDNSKFVTNRLREIRLTDCEFRFVPTALNPADLSTRGCSVQFEMVFLIGQNLERKLPATIRE
ncbi:hypothetical protein DdX_18620 [Ditylenchus destructor]|uniref:Uncharacterized protein n=1 Tax=Ditylenchus destructor TaxID=166010 RepID=A0AAD4QY43_9BILA|nr:hypothetical protein DdX_18620 [Ditylenchus destructor]